MLISRGNSYYMGVVAKAAREGVLAMLNVIKRDGQGAVFNLSKISEAIIKAFDATEVQ